jgi:hypothetical protein
MKEIAFFSSGWTQIVEEIFNIPTGVLGQIMRHEEHCLGLRYNPHSLEKNETSF